MVNSFSRNQKINTVSKFGGFMDQHVLLPASLLGVDQSPQINVGSVSTHKIENIKIQSVYDSEQSFWSSLITEI